jgi:hypothetical protein
MEIFHIAALTLIGLLVDYARIVAYFAGGIML